MRAEAKRSLIAPSLVAMCLGLSACNAADGAAGAEHLPRLYADTLEEWVEDGQNTARKNYFDHVKGCEAAGFPVTPLDKQDIARLGTTRIQRWFDEGLRATRYEEWRWERDEATPINVCVFKMVHEGYHDVTTAKGSSSTDLATGETLADPPSPEDSFQRHAYQLEPGRGSDFNALGYEGPLNRDVAGQPCTQWKTPTGDVICVWSGGRQWGFADEPIPGRCGNVGGEIVLASEPEDGTGCRVTTQKFTLGQPLPPSAYDVGQSR